MPRSTRQIRNVYLRRRFVEGDGELVFRMIRLVLLDLGFDCGIRTVSDFIDNFLLERNLCTRDKQTADVKTKEIFT